MVGAGATLFLINRFTKKQDYMGSLEARLKEIERRQTVIKKIEFLEREPSNKEKTENLKTVIFRAKVKNDTITGI